MKLMLFLYAILITSCAFYKVPDAMSGSKCAIYEPSCGYLGAGTECTYNKDGCRTCTCVPIPGSQFDEKKFRP